MTARERFLAALRHVAVLHELPRLAVRDVMLVYDFVHGAEPVEDTVVGDGEPPVVRTAEPA